MRSGFTILLGSKISDLFLFFCSVICTVEKLSECYTISCKIQSVEINIYVVCGLMRCLIHRAIHETLHILIDLRALFELKKKIRKKNLFLRTSSSQ